MPERVLAIGAHIGDMDLAAGPYLAQNILDGGASMLLALTPGERGHPTLPVERYKAQKIDEGERFAAGIGAGFEVFADQSDGLLAADETLAARLARVVRSWQPTTLLAHWRHSIHTDHENASWLAEQARFLAGLPGWEVGADGAGLHRVSRFFYTENWEDAEAFEPDTVADVGDDAYDRWRSAISGEAFARGETYGFRYIDFYSAQLTLRGCLHGMGRAVCFSTGATRRVERI